MADIGSESTPFKLNSGIATPSSEWAESTRAALEGEAPIGTGTSTTVAAPGGTMPVTTQTGTLPVTAPAAVATPGIGPQTPGLHIPGEYPVGLDAGARDLGADDVRAAAQKAREQLPTQEQVGGVLEQARNNLPAQEDIAEAAKSLAQTAAGYLPQSVQETVANYLPISQDSISATTQEKTLPSQELQGAQPGEKTGGVGALPGSVNEAAVAKLPGESTMSGQSHAIDDRPIRSPSSPLSPAESAFRQMTRPNTDTTTNQSKVDGVAPHSFKAPPRPEDMVSKSHIWPDARSHNSGGLSNKPVSVAPIVASAPAAPAHADREEVVHAQEKPQQQTEAQLLSQAPAQSSDVPSAAPELSAASAPSATPKPSAVPAPSKPETSDKPMATDKQDKVSKGSSPQPQLEPRKWKTWKGVDGDIAEQDLELADSDDGGPPVNKEAYAKNLEAQGASLDAEHHVKSKPADAVSAHTEGSAQSKNETKHKSTFMEKVKGEMKIISGKLGGDKAKVEEGKKLKSGQI